ncbi:NAD(P)/FAD-dependent oxidoreductase [Streptomyces sp. cg36]|uniref:NAD(P)/FAD-dependent oxidoreductase n=1 Tax=Streptomyces sp. cg36 TaxID=3238798 RepID=UPI0034E278DF
MLAAAAIAEYADTLTILERDRMPEHPTVRKGVPQGRHLHGLLSTGARAIDTLLPGALTSLLNHGAHHLGLAEQTLIYGPYGWMRPYPTGHFILGASRPLVEWTVHTHLLRQHRIQLIEGAEVVGLTGDADRVRGVRIRHRDIRHSRQLAADLVIDATGRSSKTSQWLAEFGIGPVPVTVVDSGLAYASRIVQVPAKAPTHRCVTVQADPRDSVPGRGGFWLHIEGGQAVITLSGTKGAHPPLDEEGFTRFARSLRHPLIGELLTSTRPVTHISGFRDTANQRRHYHRFPSLPAGLLVIGDASTTFNPLYGQGMTVAALSALALRKAWPGDHLGSAECRQIQRAIARTADLPWTVCTAEDIRYPGAKGPRPSPGLRLAQRGVDRLRAAAAHDPAAAQTFFDVLRSRISTEHHRLISAGQAWSSSE